jgi:hypothetical protein
VAAPAQAEGVNLEAVAQEDEHSAASGELEFEFDEEPSQEPTSNDKPA